MKRVKLTIDEFQKMHDDLKGSLRVTLTEIGTHPTDTKEERLEKIKKAFNPDLPRTIQMYTTDGITEYYV